MDETRPARRVELVPYAVDSRWQGELCEGCWTRVQHALVWLLPPGRDHVLTMNRRCDCDRA